MPTGELGSGTGAVKEQARSLHHTLDPASVIVLNDHIDLQSCVEFKIMLLY